MFVTHDHSAQIQDAQIRLKEPLSIEEQAGILSEIGFWYREMRKLQESRKALEESLALLPNHHYALTQLRLTLVKIGDKGAIVEAVSRLLRLDPHNPTVFDECMAWPVRRNRQKR